MRFPDFSMHFLAIVKLKSQHKLYGMLFSLHRIFDSLPSLQQYTPQKLVFLELTASARE
jgi:hypothetical protein